MYGSIPQGMTTAMPANAVNVGALSYDGMMNVNRPSNMYMGEMQSTPYTDLGEFGRTPGAYATGSRNRMPNATAFPSEVGIPRVFDGSSAGEGFFGGAVSRTFSHGTTNPTEARRIMVAAKIIQPPGTTPFHAQWIEGQAMFVVDNETPDVSRPYPTMAVAGNKPVTLVNAAQLSFYLRDAAEEAAGASLGRIVCPRPIIETAEKARESEKPERALAPEEEWYETYRKNPSVVNNAKTLLWNNIEHIRSHVRFVGFMNNMILKENRIDVELSVINNAKCFNYWGPNLKVADHIGFIIRRSAGISCNAHAVEAWRSSEHPYPDIKSMEFNDWSGTPAIGVFFSVGMIMDIDPLVPVISVATSEQHTAEQKALLGTIGSGTRGKFESLDESLRVCRTIAKCAVVSIGPKLSLSPELTPLLYMPDTLKTSPSKPTGSPASYSLDFTGMPAPNPSAAASSRNPDEPASRVVSSPVVPVGSTTARRQRRQLAAAPPPTSQ